MIKTKKPRNARIGASAYGQTRCGASLADLGDFTCRRLQNSASLTTEFLLMIAAYETVLILEGLTLTLGESVAVCKTPNLP